MNQLKKISDSFGKYMAIIVLFIAMLALFVPSSSLWIDMTWVNYLLIVIMFGIGLTMTPNDFALILKNPKDVIIGCIAQFTIMPFLAFALCHLFKLDPALTAGIVLVGACPGGTASNVITYFSKGDVAFSVCMTSINTLLAPILTPAITYLLLKATIHVDVTAMFISILQIILVPIILGFIMNHFFHKLTQKLVVVLPMVSTIAICMIIATVVSHNVSKIYTSGMLILVIVILHNTLGYFCGFSLGKLLKLNSSKTKALSIEIGMQNSGLATSLASTVFPQLAMATVPGAIFSVWHNISGAILAGLYRKLMKESE